MNSRTKNSSKFSRPFMFPVNYSSPNRSFIGLSKFTIRLLRLPLTFCIAGAGGVAYVNYKTEEFKKQYVPEWVSDSWSKTKDYVQKIDLGNFELPKLPEINFDALVKLTQSPDVIPPRSSLAETKAGKSFVVSEMEKRGSEISEMNARGLKISESDISNSSGSLDGDEDLMVLTKKLIEIRNLLKTVNTSNATTRESLTLPSIVVVGSQSSGKSSVLEAIVGHEFLPKGTNMVTRRPIELTLIHTPGSMQEYGEFPQIGIGKVNDFKQIQKTLMDLNLAVSEAECVSSSPIELRIYSPNVPNLTLIDLPGYIALHNRHQPAILKEKITDLCDQYIREPNVILAVCAADVDLANSEALRASRKVDPQGKRTIGVITKMDLVEPKAGQKVLTNQDYPLNLGYVGVICKSTGTTDSKALIRSEEAYFKSNPEYNVPKVSVGTKTLRRKLMSVLEDHMSRSLTGIVTAVETELEDARYQFKVHYNDRRISPDSYVTETMDTLKTQFREFSKGFGKPQVREEIRVMLEKRIVDILDSIYFENPKISALPKLCVIPGDIFWPAKLELASGMLTKSGVGRAAVQQVVDNLMKNMEKISTHGPFIHHPETSRRIMSFSNEILREKYAVTVDQVENTIKPYKYEVECTEQEWAEGVKRAASLLESQLLQSKEALQAIKSTLGRRKLRNALLHIQKMEKEKEKSINLPSPSDALTIDELDEESLVTKNGGIPQKALDKAVEATKLTNRISLLSTRVSALRSRQCASSTSKQCCPEAFLSVVAEKLAYTSTMFIWVELLGEFFDAMPREMDDRLYYGLGREKIEQFARENESVKRHLEVQERKKTLELAMEKLKALNKDQPPKQSRWSSRR
ncbi:dynamin-like GTPase mgm1 [Nowakowskiella sp. JEL0078]|nr:dynamin-like GTPase mgm1 [Nowakowskiella sp. JEL0078]